MDVTIDTKEAQSAREQLTGVGDVILHWIGTVAVAGAAYMTYSESEVLSLAAMGIGLFAILLLIRSLGVTLDWFR